MKWYEHITETPAFKKLDNPSTKLGHIATTIVALAFGVTAFLQNPDTSRDCKTNPLRGVYNPQRLQVIATCQTITGTVAHVSSERDGDLHIRLAVDPAYRNWLTAKNTQRQDGDLVVEYMPGDPWRNQHPTIGERLQLGCTHVLDKQHGGWAECHPVWSVQPLGNAAAQPEP